jgi:membrane protein implicated in regulation of membrane protease activity
MIILYLACFIGGLLLAVGVMIFGVERPRERHPSGERSFRLSPPPGSALAVLFGLTGYVMSRIQGGSPVSTLVVAIVFGAAASVLTARLVRKWWTVTPEHEVEDERYQLQGHLARVTKSISAGVDGEVAFEVAGEPRVLRARNFEEGALPSGTDVVIERIEDEVAYVEAWQEVEKRL